MYRRLNSSPIKPPAPLSRLLLTALVLSLVVHLGIFSGRWLETLLDKPAVVPGDPPERDLSVLLVPKRPVTRPPIAATPPPRRSVPTPRVAPPRAPEPPAPVPAPPAPVPPVVPPPPAPVPTPALPDPPPQVKEPERPVITTPSPAPSIAPTAPPVSAIPPTPQPPTQGGRNSNTSDTAKPPPAPPATDMMAMAEAARARRQGSATPSRESESDRVTSAIARNLRSITAPRESTGGVFEIISKGTRTGQFAFRGWRSDTQNKWYEVIEVDAGMGGDVELALVRGMIKLIRTRYTGNFNWESSRLGRLVVLSARLEDSRELEAFLLKEFFAWR